MPDNGQHIESVLLTCQDCGESVPVNAEGKYLPHLVLPLSNDPLPRVALYLPDDQVLCRKCKVKWLLTAAYIASYGVLDGEDMAEAAIRARDILKEQDKHEPT